MSDASGSGGRGLYRDHNLQIIFGITLMAVMGASVVTPVLPRVEEVFGLSQGRVALLLTVFTLPGVVLTPVLGVLSDRFGRKRVLVPSLLLFGVAGGACVFARSFEVLLALRFVQGIGVAALGTLNVTLIGDLYAGQERSAAMGYNASILSIGTGSYPAIGGALALLGWYYPFALPVLAVPIGLLALFYLKAPEPQTGAAGLKAYFRNVRDILRDRRVIGLLCATLMTFVILYGPLLTYLPMLMSRSFGASSLVTGVILSSVSFAAALTSWQLGRLTGRFSEKTLVKAAFVFYLLALCIFPLVPLLPLLVAPAVIFGVAQGIGLPSIFTLLTSSAATENRGALLALNGLGIRLGQTVGPALMGLAALALGITGAFYTGALATFAVLLLVAALVR